MKITQIFSEGESQTLNSDNFVEKRPFIFTDSWGSGKILRQFQLIITEEREIWKSENLVLKFIIRNCFDTQNFNIWTSLL